MVDIKQLKTFIAVADSGSLSRASDRMRLAQPALSRQIKLLEDRIGRPLFVRYGRGMELTETGRSLLERVSGLVHQLERSLDDVRSIDDVPSGHVALGMMPTTSYILAGRVAQRVATELPDVSLRIVEAYAGHLIDWLHKGDVDISLLYGPAADLHLRATELFYEDLVLVGPRSANLDGQIIPVGDLKAMALVLPSRRHGLRAVAESAAAKAGISLTVRFEADSFLVIKSLVVSGLGYTLLPLSSFNRAVERDLFSIAKLVKPKVARQVILALPYGRSDTRATTAVRDIVLDEIRGLIASGEWEAHPDAGLRA